MPGIPRISPLCITRLSRRCSRKEAYKAAHVEAKRAMHAALAVSLGALVASQHPMNGKVPGMVNSGTPGGVPAGYDCAVREHAW